MENPKFRTPEEHEEWLKLRSDIYIRDKGICWICNMFVDLKDYDLGHLVDRTRGGEDKIENCAVMHKSCNIAKPRHNTLTEALAWQLKPKNLEHNYKPQLSPNENQMNLIPPAVVSK